MNSLEASHAAIAKAKRRVGVSALGFLGSLVLLGFGAGLENAALTFAALGFGAACVIGGLIAVYREWRAHRAFWSAAGLTDEQISQKWREENDAGS
ncbi:hypothetical protein [Hansschlegelia zhihuaiae]|uniref:Uncharacterized protein n=1 Tax=Hansschlegelia zhihuaiae TaxID=405005 RepID=A0A4Q0MK32_9HYPH|nr:hypothetical protein [Hansschlegelia zhihuaiae]RXF73928.1 hypothetical protein EK403_08135 [Hansschlegelia zhihuaiae]